MGETFQLLGPEPCAKFIGSPRPFELNSNPILDASGNPVVDEYGNKVEAIYAPGPMLQGIPTGLRLVAGPNTRHGGVDASWTSDVLPQGQISCIRGPAKVGKTLLGHEILARLSHGESVLDLPASGHLNGLLITAPEGGEVVRHWPRLRAAAADTSRVNVVTHWRLQVPLTLDETYPVSLDALSLAEKPHLLRTAIERLGVSVVVLNTFTALAHCASGERDDEYLDRLGEVAQQLQVAIVLIDYRDGTALSRLIQQRARVILDLDWDRRDRNRRTLRAWGTQLPSEGLTWSFEISAVSGVERITWLTSGEDVKAPARRGPAPDPIRRAWLKARLAQPVLRDVVIQEADARGYPRGWADREHKRLGATSTPVGDGSARVCWHLPGRPR
jgi:hypothetical protein